MVEAEDRMECEPTNKRIKLSESNAVERLKPNIGESSVSNAVASVNLAINSLDIFANDQPQAEIFNLKMDHFEKFFDWLSVKDLIALGLTCKRMQRYVGYCLKTNYFFIDNVKSTGDGVYLQNANDYPGIELNGLSSYLKELPFADSEINMPCMKDHFKYLTKLYLNNVVLTTFGISLIKPILGQLETLKLLFTKFLSKKQEFYASFLQHCTNIKRLHIVAESGVPIIGVDNSWLQRKYPKLEHFEVITLKRHEISELKVFFELNAHLKSFTTNEQIILANQNAFIHTELELDALNVLA